MDPPLQPIVGQTVYFYFTALDIAGTPANISSPTLKLKPPNAASVNGTNISQTGPGAWRGKYIPTVPGTWAFHWEGSDGTDTYIYEQMFTVVAKQVP